MRIKKSKTGIVEGDLTPMIDMTSSVLGLENKEDLSPVGLGEPQDVANVVLFLASDESRYVNGSEIVLDNAMSIQ